jgi:hypothetical protein
MPDLPLSDSIPLVHFPAQSLPCERTAANELARIAGVRASAASRPGRGVSVALASRRWFRLPPAASKADRGWIWMRIEGGKGEICADEPALLYAAVRLLSGGLPDRALDRLARGLFLPASFGWHRPHWDGCYTQYWRSARGFDPERYVATLAESGFTHVEVNSLEAHLPFEDTVPFEYYPQFYTYAPGFNHFVATPLSEGIWPTMYLEANLNRLKHLAELGRRYGLRPGVCMFEPRSFPDRFFQKYPTLRGARVDHPFRSRLPRYCLAQDHPVSQAHYRDAMSRLVSAVPDLAYMSVWTNDSGAGFEHTASLYVGRNGGPYMIREWRSHEKIAAAAGASIARFLGNLQGAAAKTNPDFDVILRIEPFKVEHEAIKAGMGGHVSWEAPSLLVRGYSLPYAHPRYPEQRGVAGTVFHTTMEPEERKVLLESRRSGIEPVLHYSPGPIMNHEPLLGIPFPRSLHAKLLAMRETGITRASALGGLAHPQASPWWPNPAAIRAAQFFPRTPLGDILLALARQWVGERHAPALVSAWDAFEEAVTWQPTVPLFTGFGFCWQRTWDRPLVPDIEAIPARDRAYYEKQGCFQHNNPALVDLGKDVLFDLITRRHGEEASRGFDAKVLPRLDRLIASLGRRITAARANEQASRVFTDLRDRALAYRSWCLSLRNVCAWCAHMYGWLESKGAAARRRHARGLQHAIDLEIGNARDLIALLESGRTEVSAVSAAGDNTFFYGENLPQLLRTKIRLMERYRHHTPRIPADIMWRPVPGTQWPRFE